MTEGEAETKFQEIRWNSTNGEAVCPHCGGLGPYIARRPSGLLRFRCKACRKDFTITSGTLFAAHKAPLRFYLAAIAVFMNEVKGKNALALSRDLGMSHKACWVLLHKVREAMAEEFKGGSWVVLARLQKQMGPISGVISARRTGAKPD